MSHCKECHWSYCKECPWSYCNDDLDWLESPPKVPVNKVSLAKIKYITLQAYNKVTRIIVDLVARLSILVKVGLLSSTFD